MGTITFLTADSPGGGGSFSQPQQVDDGSLFTSTESGNAVIIAVESVADADQYITIFNAAGDPPGVRSTGFMNFEGTPNDEDEVTFRFVGPAATTIRFVAETDAGNSIDMKADDGSGIILNTFCTGTNTLSINTESSSDIVFSTEDTNALVVDGADQGLYTPNATGGSQGADTINASAVYDDGVLLVSMPLSDAFKNTGTFSVDEWEQKNERTIPSRRVRRKNAEGQIEIVTLPATIKRPVNNAARYFDDMLKSGFDPRKIAQYFARVASDKTLPGMPTEAEWQSRGGKFTLGEMQSRVWLTLDMMALQIKQLHDELATLKAK